MKVGEIASRLGLQVVAGYQGLEREVLAGYAADLLSAVIAHAPPGCLWVTLQTHENIVAVALLVDAAGIVVTSGRDPEEATRRRADAEGIPILTTKENTFIVAGELYKLLNF
ncbi:DRTGG domain-containing protein [Thermanaeromonas toyohensis ToBE]|uniref:DRTGG domain-containing protein n=1 Tax=Thermanaeromonas toyohensis ToBE TaxID=698762 RepID=A0A1W1W006_9FIRM|nr:DRTGG domain-containing protein [Thermanaeromonas toyohensis]SMB98928.1 DRTGG domain-containing protein [Thermanaeromonas toyohensis ToBE]